MSENTAALLTDLLPLDAELRSLGRHRLKDLAQPQEIFQLIHPKLPADFPPPRSLEAFTHNLPLQLSSFVGREAEIAQAKQLLAQNRLLTLTGTGGAGKTRLALQAAAEVIEQFEHGVWFVELAPLTDGGLVEQEIAAALGLREEGEKRLRQTLTDALRPKSLLLILDNCEHLIDTCARLAETLLRACPHLHLLTTSREALAIDGEALLPLSSLSMPDDPEETETETLAQCEAIRLFIDRATTALPTFRFSAGNAQAVAQVCAQLDGIPLALELAAARVKVLTPQQIAERLDDRFRLLSGGSRTALPRQQTLRALIDWSYDLLAPTEQTLLRRLSVFLGGWSLEGAESVCSGGSVEEWEVLDLLSRLVAKSLVVVEPPSEGQVRYHLLQNLRRYAGERLAETEEAAQLPLRHRDWFLAHAEAAEPHLSGPQQGSWLNQLARDHDNLRVALTFSHDRESDAESELRLATALWKFWWIRGHFREGRNFLRRALTRSEGGNASLRARASNNAGILADAQGDYQSAVSCYQESLVMCRSVSDEAKTAQALNNLGNTFSSLGDWERARGYYEQSLAIYRAHEDEGRTAILMMNIGIVANHQQEYGLARSLYEESLAIFRKRNDRGQLAVVLINLGEVTCNLAEYDAARLYLLESLQIAEALGEKEWIASILLTLAYTTWPQGRYEQAAKLFGAAMDILNSQGLSLSPRDQVSFTKNSDIVHAHLGETKFQAAWRQGEGAKLSQLIRELS